MSRSYTYFGCDIRPYNKLGSPFRWESYVNGQFMYADTLAGMRELIKSKRILNMNMENIKDTIGTPVWHRDKLGYVYSSRPVEGLSMLLGSGLQEIKTNYVVVYVDHTGEADYISEIHDLDIVEDMAEAKARNILPLPEECMEVLYQVASNKAEQRKLDHRRKQEEANLARQQFEDSIKDKIPSWAKAVIIGTQIIDKSDSMTDYFGHDTGGSVILGFSKHTRDLFPEMRKFAANAPETEHLADAPESVEHRENTVWDTAII